MLSNDHILKQKSKLDPALIERVLDLNDDEFCKLADARLNKLLSENKVKELGIAEEYDNREYWTVEHLIDELFLKIAGTKVIINHNGKSLTIRKYYNQALRLLNWIPIAKPTPEFLVNISDLTPRIVTELKALTGQTCYNYVLNFGKFNFTILSMRCYCN